MPSTKHSRITKADFRPCLTCRSHSQALLYLYAYTLISIQSKSTFARLRYSLASDRPSQTAHQTLFLLPFPDKPGKIYNHKREVFHWRPKSPSYTKQSYL